MVLGDGVRFTSNGQLWVNRAAPGQHLQEYWLQPPEPRIWEQTRRYYGRALTPEVIELVLRSAELGYMRDLTDLIYETIKIDAHLASVINKRFRGVSVLKPQVVPASGDGLDERLASTLADVVRQQLAWIPNFRAVVNQLNWAHCFGRAASELVWKENPGGSDVQWRVERVHWIHPRRLSLGPERELRIRDDLYDGVPFSPRGVDMRQYPFKFLQFTPQSFNEYIEREGFGPRALYWSFFKRFSWRERLVLLEVFGKPWRIAYVDDPKFNVQRETLEEAQELADNLGGSATGGMPPGVKVDTQQPDPRTGENHAATATDADDELSKLVLGQSRTTDAKPGALGSSADDVALSEEDEIKAVDGSNVSDVLSEQLSGAICVLNFGPDVLDHAPRIELRYERAKNPTQELERARVLVVDLGAPVKRDELYERAGFTKPEPGDDVLEAPAQPAGLPGFPGVPGLPGLPSLPVGDAGGGSPLGDGGASLPDVGDSGDEDRDQFRSDQDVTLLRAARVLELMNELQRR